MALVFVFAPAFGAAAYAGRAGDRLIREAPAAGSAAGGWLSHGAWPLIGEGFELNQRTLEYIGYGVIAVAILLMGALYFLHLALIVGVAVTLKRREKRAVAEAKRAAAVQSQQRGEWPAVKPERPQAQPATSRSDSPTTADLPPLFDTWGHSYSTQYANP